VLRLAAAQDFHGRMFHDRLVARRLRVHAWAQDAFGGHMFQFQHLGEVPSLFDPFDFLKIALAPTQRRNLAGEDAGVTHGLAAQRRYRHGIHRQIRALVPRHANEYKPRAEGEIGVRFVYDKPP
jgi:hypothetical protein